MKASLRRPSPEAMDPEIEHFIDLIRTQHPPLHFPPTHITHQCILHTLLSYHTSHIFTPTIRGLPFCTLEKRVPFIQRKR